MVVSVETDEVAVTAVIVMVSTNRTNQHATIAVSPVIISSFIDTVSLQNGRGATTVVMLRTMEEVLGIHQACFEEET